MDSFLCGMAPIILWIVFYVEWHQLYLRFKGRVAAVAAKAG